MRTTIDIPPDLHRRIKAYADAHGQSFSFTATEALLRGMAPIDTLSTVHRSPVTGLMVFTSGRGRTITSEEVADLIDEDDYLSGHSGRGLGEALPRCRDSHMNPPS